jgi:hypothetical protein
MTHGPGASRYLVADGWNLDEDTSPRWRQVLPQIVVAVWLPLCFAFASLNQSLLPEKYFADSKNLEGLALTATGPSADSFVTTAWIYRALGGLEYPVLTYLVTLALFFILVFRCANWTDISRFSLIETALFCFCGIEAAIYLAQYSKESLVLLVVLALVVMPRPAWGDILFMVMACGYALMIRNYWFLIAVAYAAFRLLLRSRNPYRIPIFVVIAMVCMAFGTAVALGVNLNSFREVVSQTNSLYAQTAIQDYIPVTGPLGGASNALCTLLLLLVPIPLAVSGSPVYLAFAVVMAVLWITLLMVVRTGMRNGWFVFDVRLARAVSLLLAMVTVLAVFEPDYGSYIKHLTPVLPLFFFVLRARRTHHSGNELDRLERQS